MIVLLIDFYTPYPSANFGLFNFKNKGITEGAGKHPHPGLAQDQKAQDLGVKKIDKTYF